MSLTKETLDAVYELSERSDDKWSELTKRVKEALGVIENVLGGHG